MLAEHERDARVDNGTLLREADIIVQLGLQRAVYKRNLSAGCNNFIESSALTLRTAKKKPRGKWTNEITKSNDVCARHFIVIYHKKTNVPLHLRSIKHAS